MVDRTLGAVGPLDAHCDRDGVAVVADVEAVEFAGPLVGRVLDGLTVHTPSVEQMFAQRKRSLSRRLATGAGHRAGRVWPRRQRRWNRLRVVMTESGDRRAWSRRGLAAATLHQNPPAMGPPGSRADSLIFPQRTHLTYQPSGWSSPSAAS
jgi:hypothetical protein